MKRYIPLNGFYSLAKEITLAGTKEDIALLSRAMLFNGDSNYIDLYVPDDSPAPYQGFVEGIQLCDATGPLEITSTPDVLVIEGSCEGRQWLANALWDAIREAEVNSDTKSLKIQYYAEHPYLNWRSSTLIVNIIGFGTEN